MDRITAIASSGRKFAIAAATTLIALVSTPTVASVVFLNSNAQEAIFDDQTNYYWYRDVGGFTSNATWTSLADVQNGISRLNQSSYFGIGNWRLSALSELEELRSHAGIETFSSLFIANGYVSGQSLFGYVPPVCLPGIPPLGIPERCLGGNPGTLYSYTQTEWDGVVLDQSSFTQRVRDPDNHPYCGHLGFPACETINVEVPAHLVAKILRRVYEDGSPLADRDNLTIFLAPDSGIGGFDDQTVTTIHGAWIVGTLDTPSNDIPEPSTLLIALGALFGLIGKTGHSSAITRRVSRYQ